MKKQLLSTFAALAAGTLAAQVSSPSWQTLQSPSFTLPIAGTRFMDAVSPNDVWLSGYDGQQPDLNYNFFSVTNNGGLSYTSGNIYADTNTYNLSSLEGIDANTCWATAYMKSTQSKGAVHKTTNGGASWVNMTSANMYTNNASFANWVAFVTPSIGIANGDPINGDFELWRTIDGGNTWTLVPGANIPNPVAGEFAIVDMYDKIGPNHIWFGTNQGRVFRSSDAGQTWSVAQVAPTSTVIEVKFATVNDGLALMVVSNALALYRTTNGGASWSAVPGGIPANYGLSEMCRIPGTPYFASCGNGNGTTSFQGLSYSKDGGLTWIDWGSTGLGYTTIDFYDITSGWAGGFTNFPDPSWPGIWKFTGVDFNSQFTVPSVLCFPSTGNATVSPVNNSGGNPPLSFQWSSNPPAQFSSATATTPVITFTATGSYTISLAVSNPDGTNTSTQVINVVACSSPTANFNLPAGPICNNVALTLTNTSTGGPAPTVSISTTPAANVTVTMGAGSQHTIRFGDPGTYTVTLVATNAGGTASATQTILIADCTPTVMFTLPYEAVCRGRDTVLTNNMSQGVLSHTWSISPTSGVSVFQSVGSGTLTNRRIVFSTSSSASGEYTVILKASNVSGTNSYSRTVMVTPGNCVGVNETSGLESNLNLFPNPASSKLKVTLPANGDSHRIQVINVVGSIVHEEIASGRESTIDVSMLQKGIYFITVDNGTEKVTRKLIVE